MYASTTSTASISKVIMSLTNNNINNQQKMIKSDKINNQSGA